MISKLLQICKQREGPNPEVPTTKRTPITFLQTQNLERFCYGIHNKVKAHLCQDLICHVKEFEVAWSRLTLSHL